MTGTAVNGQMNTAVLFLVFNRPEATRAVFAAIRAAKPPRLYVAADGPRPDRTGEVELVNAVRGIATSVDWDCEVRTLFRDRNLGCKSAVSSAITWFFEHEDEGIILEDDCLPAQSFFNFCETLLERYRSDSRVWMIAGYTIKPLEHSEGYRYSRLVPIWGWATWRRAWKNYDIEMSDFEVQNDEIYKPFLRHAKNVKETFASHITQKIETWDTQWAYACVKNRALTILPSHSLISNIGFSKDATHTKKPDKVNSKVKARDLDIKPARTPHHDENLINKLDEEYLDMFYKRTIFGQIMSIFR